MSSVCTRMSAICNSYVLVWHPCITRIYSYTIRISLVCTSLSFICHSYVLECNGMSLVYTCMSSVFHSYLLVCLPYVTRMYSCVIRIPLVCTRLSSVYHSYVVLLWTIENPAFCLALYLTGVHFRGELQDEGHVGEQKIDQSELEK